MICKASILTVLALPQSSTRRRAAWMKGLSLCWAVRSSTCNVPRPQRKQILIVGNPTVSVIHLAVPSSL